MMGESRRDTRVMGECKRQASDGGEQANDGGVMGECKRQANDGGEAGEWWGRGGGVVG